MTRDYLIAMASYLSGATDHATFRGAVDRLKTAVADAHNALVPSGLSLRDVTALPVPEDLHRAYCSGRVSPATLAQCIHELDRLIAAGEAVLSQTHVERMRDELYALDAKIARAQRFVQRPDFAADSKAGGLLVSQIAAMTEYRQCLAARLKLEGQ